MAESFAGSMSTPLAASVGPWSGFALAADAAVRDLHRRFGLDLWMTTHVDQDRQVVVASAGPWDAIASPSVAFSWAQSFCLRMVSGGGPVAVPDVQGNQTYAAVAVGGHARVRAYVGVPLLSSDGNLFGTLCALAGEPQPASLTAVLEPAALLGRMLSTIISGEQMAADRSAEAALAYALADRDRLTGLRNQRGWEAALAAEEQRARRYGSSLGVLVLDLDDLNGVNDRAGHAAGDVLLRTCAEVLTQTCRPGDTLARLGGDEFGVLAVECDPACARALAMRLRVRLRSAGVPASLGWSTRRPDESLQDSWHRADEQVYRAQRRRLAAQQVRRPHPR